MQNLIDENPVLLCEKGTAADNAGDYEKAALFYTLADALELIEDNADTIAELEKDLENRADYTEHKQFFYDCFERLGGHYPRPEVSSSYDCRVIFDAIEKGKNV